MKPDLALSSVVCQNREPVAVDVDESVVMMSLQREMYYSLEGAGGRIWRLVEVPRAVSEVCETLMAEFDVEPETCRREVLAFLDRLHREGLIEIQP